MNSMRMLLIAIVACALAGCGFQIRGPAQLPFSTMHLQVAPTSTFGNELKRVLRASNTRLVEKADEAQATLAITGELRDKQILSLGGGGRVRGYQLRYRITYRVTDATSKDYTPAGEILLTREISFNDSQILAKEAEEVQLYRDMQTDAVQQLVRRLRLIKVES